MQNNNNMIVNAITIGAIGAAAGLAYAAMSPMQHKRVEKNLKKTVNKLSNVVDDMQDKAEKIF